MRNTVALPLACSLSIWLLLVAAVQARRHHVPVPPAPGAATTPVPEPPALPSEAAPTVPAGVPPSASLGPFLDTHLGTVLAPLGQAAFTQTEVITSLKASYADRAGAEPADHQPVWQLAQGVCDLLAKAINERQNAVTALRGALASRSSEAVQPRGGAAEGVEKARQDDNFFLESQKNIWVQRAGVLRASIVALYTREREAERYVSAWTPSPAAAPTPAVAATTDPVTGNWMWKDDRPVKIEDGGGISGSRHGRWTCTMNTGTERYYEFKWDHPGWMDLMKLSTDGKTLEGKTGGGKPVFAKRL